nr:SH3 domain-containing protein [uncultured Massilia sp.]
MTPAQTPNSILSRLPSWRRLLLCAALAGAAGAPAASGAADVAPVSAAGVPAFSEDMLSPEFWVGRVLDPDIVLLDGGQVKEKRARAYAAGGGLLDLRSIPATLTRAQVGRWIEQAEQTPIKAVVDEHGRPVKPATLQALRRNTAAGRIPASAPARHGLSVRRAQLRALPAEQRFYAAADQRDYESLQAGILFPGEPVVIAHESADRQWLLVVSSQGPAWVRAADIGIGKAETVFAYAEQAPGRVVTGDQVRTVFTPEAPALSELELDMGTALPLANVAPGEPVNGASPVASWPLLLPVREPDGSLAFKAALLRRAADSAPGYLPLTRANLIRQAFKFLGERYGWGHMFNARDCSGLTSEVYRSMGILLAPSSGVQGTSAALQHRTFGDKDTHEDRVRALAKAQVGDLVVVPGHVLMIIGHLNGQPYVIQDVPYAVFKDAQSGQIRKTKLNQVSVTPLLPLYADDKTLYVDAMTSLVHVTRP